MKQAGQAGYPDVNGRLGAAAISRREDFQHVWYDKQAMTCARDILKFTDEIARQFKPRKIILFGSYAYGNPTEDSDVDLLVIKPHRVAGYKEAARICEGIERSFPLDMLVLSPTEVSRRLSLQDYFINEIVHGGITLYEEDDTRVGEKGRRRLRRRLAYAPFTQPTTV